MVCVFEIWVETLRIEISLAQHSLSLSFFCTSAYYVVSVWLFIVIQHRRQRRRNGPGVYLSFFLRSGFGFSFLALPQYFYWYLVSCHNSFIIVPKCSAIVQWMCKEMVVWGHSWLIGNRCLPLIVSVGKMRNFFSRAIIGWHESTFQCI